MDSGATGPASNLTSFAGLPSRQRSRCCAVPLCLKLFLELVATGDVQHLRMLELSE